jgi:hypothetical protein
MLRSAFGSRRRSIAFGAALVAGGAGIGALGGPLVAAPPEPPTLTRDAALSFRFTGSTPLWKAVDGMRLGPADGSGEPTPTGVFVTGRPLVDRATGRSVVVRPEAIREYFALVTDLSPADAAIQTERVLARLERTGDLRPLAKIDLAVREAFGPTSGVRLDRPETHAVYPAQLQEGSPLMGLRTLIAGDDSLWRDYFVDGDIAAFAALAENPGYERFHHSADPSTGIANADSDLRLREHRRVIVHRLRNYVTFLPTIPMHLNLSDAGFAAGTDFRAVATRSLRSSAKVVALPGGSAIKFIRGIALFRTGPDAGDGGAFGGDTVQTATGTGTEAPRVVNVTPPNDETSVDLTTDWEDPDNRYTVPVLQRKPFVYRVRFSKPLDPRTVVPSTVSLLKVATLDAFGNPTLLPSPQPVAAGVFLSQRRMGEVLVEVQPWDNLDPQARYELRVADTVKALDGTPSGMHFTASCETR